MNHRYGFFPLFLAVFVFFFTAFPTLRAAEDKIHIVAKGETVYSISRMYRISQEELMKRNGISDPGKLQEGQRLRIPQPPGAAAAGTGVPSPTGTQSGGYSTYTVVKNDTLFSLARKYEISVQKLRELNGFSTNYVIKVGEIIKVPAKPGELAVNVDPPPGGMIVAPPGKQADTVHWPIKPGKITYMTGKLPGVTIVGEHGESVKSLTRGTVVSSGPYRGFGKGVIVEVDGGYLYLYGGLESLSVKEGDRIGPGMELGKLGINAVSEKAQLFFTVYQKNVPIDPAKAPRA